MTFRTAIEPKPWVEKIDYRSHIVCLGSCFANNIAKLLSTSKFRVTASPTGILFNPASIARAMELMMGNRHIDENALIELGDRFVSYDFHSSIAGHSREEAIENMNNALLSGGEAIGGCDLLIATLGTAWAYRLVESGEAVANCHKQPASLFERRLLSVAEVVKALERIVELTPRRVVFTLSPVRHLGEGLEDNSLSKSVLRVAIDEICRLHKERVAYFPSYEIMMDDLRDYRFYDADMLHPSAVAVEYIAQRFFDVALSAEAKVQKLKVDKIVEASQHRPFDHRSANYRRFCQQQLEAIESLKGVDLSKEKAEFSDKLQINL